MSACSLLLACALLLPPEARSQQWLFTPEIEIAAQHIDNPRLDEVEDSGDTETITGGLLDIAAALRRNTETSSFLLRPAAAVYRYSGDTDEDSEAYFLDLNAQTTGQRSSWRLIGNYSQQQVFRGETTSSDIDEPGVDDSVQTGTGRTFEPRQRDMWRIGPGATFQMTQRTSLELEFNYLDVSYDTEELGEAIDYNNSRVGAGIVYALTPDSDLVVGAFASRYEPDGTEVETDSFGAGVRYQKEVSDISSFYIDVGGQEADLPSSEALAEDETETSFLWSIGYDRQLEVTRWHFDLGQTVSPSGSGALVERNLFRAIMEHQFQPRWSTRLSGVVMRTSTLGGETLVFDNERDYFQGRAALSYQVTRNWTLEGMYGFTYQDFENLPGDGQEHELRLSFIYRPPLPST